MQNFNQTESTINYQNYPSNLSQQPIQEPAVSYEASSSSTTEESLAALDNASYQNDSNSAFFSGESSFGTQNSSFVCTEKYSNNFAGGQQPIEEISQTSIASSNCSTHFDEFRQQQSMIKMNTQASLAVQLKGAPADEQPIGRPVLIQSPNQTSLQSPLTRSPANTSPCSNSKSQSFSSPPTPAKPKSTKKKNESIKKLYTLSNEPERAAFLDQLLAFNEQKKLAMANCPTVAKAVIDLFRIYKLVKERGGFVAVSRAYKWKELAEICQLPITSTTAYSLRKQYGKYLLPFECKFDRTDDRDPEELYKEIEIELKGTKKHSSGSKSKSNANQNGQPQQPGNYQALALPAAQQPAKQVQQPNIQSQSIQPQSPFPNYSKQQSNQMMKPSISYNNNQQQIMYETSLAPAYDQTTTAAQHQEPKMVYMEEQQNYMNSSMSGQMSDQMSGGQMNGQMNGQMSSQMSSQMSGQMSGQNQQMNNQMTNQMSPGSMGNQMNSPMNSQMTKQMNSQISNQMTSQMANQMTSQMTNQMTNQITSQMNHGQMSTNESLMNYDPNNNLYQQNQQVLNPDYAADAAFYNQPFETDGHSNYHAPIQVLQKSTPVSMQQQPQQYYADPNQYNSTSYTSGYGVPMQYSNAYAYPDARLYTDTSRMPVNRAMSNEQQQSFAANSYQYPGGTYEYAQQQQQQQQPNRATSQTNYSSGVVQYQAIRAQKSAPQQFMIDQCSNLDVSMHRLPIEGWQMNNQMNSQMNNQMNNQMSNQISNQMGNQINNQINNQMNNHNGSLPNNWTPNAQNCLQIYQQPTAAAMNAQHQAVSIESQISKPQLPAAQRIVSMAQQPAPHYYASNMQPNAAQFAGRYNQPHSTHLHPNAMHHQQLTAFSSASPSLHPLHSHHPQSSQANVSPKHFLGRDTHFPADCVEAVKPKPDTKKRLTAKDLPPQDPSKLLLAIKSGQLVESTKVINHLIVLSAEDPAGFKETKLKDPKNRALQSHLISQFRDLLSKLFPQLFGCKAPPDNNNNHINVDRNDRNGDAPICNELSEEQKRKVSQFITEDNCLVADKRAVRSGDSDYLITSMYPDREYDRKSFDEMLPNDKSRGFSEELHENEVKPEEISPLCTISQHKEDSNQRCIALSTLVRNLSFLKGNDEVLSRDEELLFILGKIIMYEHQHTEKRTRSSEQLAPFGGVQTDFEQPSKEAWWYEALHMIQGNALVTLSNISAHLNFEKKDEQIILPILEGLLHWSTCPSSIALDAFESSTSRKRLAFECLVKLSVYEANVDLLLATPTLSTKSQAVFGDLVNQLSRNQPQIMREFTLVLLCNFIKSDRNVATAICASGNIVEQLVRYLEEYKDALERQRGHSNSQQPADATTMSMAKKAASCLADLAKVPENNLYFNQKQERLVALLTSEIFDGSGLCSLLQDIVYEVPDSRQPKTEDAVDSMETGGGYITK